MFSYFFAFFSSGLITVSPDARLDLETGSKRYDVIVYAVDSGVPVRETATTTVTVNVMDVNNKPPAFDNNSYTVYLSEKAAIGNTPSTTEKNIFNNILKCLILFVYCSR